MKHTDPRNAAGKTTLSSRLNLAATLLCVAAMSACSLFGGGDDDAAADTGQGGVTDAAGGADTATDASDAGGKTGPWWVCPPEVSNDKGLLHGKKCTADGDCKYGRCMFGTAVVGYDATKGICTKNNNCAAVKSGPTVACGVDNTATDTFDSVFEKTKSSGNDKRTGSEVMKMCGRTCKSDGECAAWNPDTPHCAKTSTKYVSFGTHNMCIFDPTK